MSIAKLNVRGLAVGNRDLDLSEDRVEPQLKGEDPRGRLRCTPLI